MLKLAVFLLCVLPLASAGGLANKVLLFPQKTDYSYVKITPIKPLSLTAFTLCMRVATAQQGQRELVLFAYRMPEEDELSVWIEKDRTVGLYLGSSSAGVRFYLPTPLSTIRTHLCFTWSSSTGLAAAWMNGQRIIYQKYKKGLTIRSGGTVVLGQDPDSLLGGFNAEQCFVGEIGDVNLWDQVLTAKEIQGLYLQSTAVKVPNVINWRTAVYTIIPGSIVEVVDF